MIRAKTVSTILVAAAALAGASRATAQVMVLSEFTWDTTKTGSQQWQQAANWSPAGFPNDPLHTANLSRPLGANLNVDIGAGVKIAGVTLGATAAPRTTEISSSTAGLLTFRNNESALTADFNSTTIVDGVDFLTWQRGFGLGGQTTNANGDADLNGTVNGLDFQAWKDEFTRGAQTIVGSAYVRSLGVAGSVHTISAGIHSDNEQIEFAGTNNVTVNGPFTYIGDPAGTVPGQSASALRVLNAGLTVTMNGGITAIDADADEGVDMSFNDHERAKGRLILNGAITGTGDLAMGNTSNGAGLGTIELNGANTFTGSIRFGRGNVILGSDNAIGINPGPTPDLADDTLATFRQAGPANQFGYNLISTSDTRVLRNDMTLAQWQSFKGNNSLTLSGTISQTNNRGLINLLPAGKSLTLSGRVNIWEDDATDDVIRELEFDGTGRTVLTGTLRDDPLDSGLVRRLRKTGTGTLVINVAAGGNSHFGVETIDMGNMHFATNDSLNVGGGLIKSRGGAVGVDTGVANNSTFIGSIDPTSTGGLMLAPSDSAATLDFSPGGNLDDVPNMTVAPPEGAPYTFTGSIVPANSKYGLGGGTGTLTLPTAQLTGAGNKVEIRNGGTVQLLGNNTYGGSTTILTQYHSTHEDQAAGDAANSADAFHYTKIAPTLVVNKLANGGQPSSIGNSTSDAANLFIQAGTLKYTGAGDSTDRLFTIGTGGATIDASGTGPLVFSNAGALARDDAEDRMGKLDDPGLNPDGTPRVPNVLYDFGDTSDIIIGMTVSDPDQATVGVFPPVPAAGAPNRIPAGTTVTGVSDDGTSLGISSTLPPVTKPTRIVFGTVPRTLTLSATLASGANTLTPIISNSQPVGAEPPTAPRAPGIVNVAKTGPGTWILGGANNYTGTTTVQGGTLIVNGAQTGGGAYSVAAGATIGGGGTLGGNLTVHGTVDPGAVGALAGTLSVTGNATMAFGSTTLIEIGGTGAAQFDQLNMTGTMFAGGTLDIDLLPGYAPTAGHSFDIFDFTSASGSFALSLPALGGGLGWVTSSLLTTGTISIVGGLATAVPEPSAVALMGIGLIAVVRQRRRRATQ